MTATLNPLYRFDTLVVGAANRLAFTAAKAVAESPGTVYNPLFIYARPGLGKTHLLMGIGHAARAINPRLTVEYLTLDEFVESFHAAVAAGQGEAYRRRAGETGRQRHAQSAHNGQDLEERGPCPGGCGLHAEFVRQQAR